MSLARRVEPELLDQLPANDPRAIRSRRDLTRVNAWMRNAACMASALRRYAGGRQPQIIADLGCGDGQFMVQVARRLAPYWRNTTVILQDRQNIVSEATRESIAALHWRAETVTADVLEFLAEARSRPIDAITANLFLHHFTGEQLAQLFAQMAQRAWLVVACEPRRAKFVVESSRMLWAVGCNDVTVHDAMASARAGFTGAELSALWPEESQWEVYERPAPVFSHCFVARRLTTANDAEPKRL